MCCWFDIPSSFRKLDSFGMFVMYVGSGAKMKFWIGVRRENEPFLSSPKVGRALKSIDFSICTGRVIGERRA